MKRTQIGGSMHVTTVRVVICEVGVCSQSISCQTVDAYNRIKFPHSRDRSSNFCMCLLSLSAIWQHPTHRLLGRLVWGVLIAVSRLIFFTVSYCISSWVAPCTVASFRSGFLKFRCYCAKHSTDWWMLLQGRHLIGQCYRGSVPSLQRFAQHRQILCLMRGDKWGNRYHTRNISVEEAAIE